MWSLIAPVDGFVLPDDNVQLKSSYVVFFHESAYGYYIYIHFKGYILYINDEYESSIRIPKCLLITVKWYQYTEIFVV